MTIALGTTQRQTEKKLTAPPEQRTQEPWHGEHDVTMRDGLEHLLGQPFGPEDGALLLVGGAERSSATRAWDQVAQATRLAPSACEAMRHVTALDEPAQHALEDGTERTVRLGGARRRDTQGFLDLSISIILFRDEVVTLPGADRGWA